jgi:hypothetical protein
VLGSGRIGWLPRGQARQPAGQLYDEAAVNHRRLADKFRQNGHKNDEKVRRLGSSRSRAFLCFLSLFLYILPRFLGFDLIVTRSLILCFQLGFSLCRDYSF